MPIFIVKLSAYACLSGEIEIKADSPEEAAKLAKNLHGWEIEWEMPDGVKPALGTMEIDEVFDWPESTDEPFEMRLCETRHVMLKPNMLYRFTVDESCPECRKMALAATADGTIPI